MRISKLAATLMMVAMAALLAACGGSSQNDEAAIREQNKKFLEAIVAKDAPAIALIYAEDGALLPPNAPKNAGREDVEKAWAAFLQLPGMTLTFETEKLVLASSGDLAVDVGTYKSTTGEGATLVGDTGKSVVTWVKRDGKWLILTDMFSSDLSPPPPPPAAPAAETPAVEPATPAATTPPTPETPAPAKPTP